MAGFEVVVRPVVFPNIRPPAPRALAIEDAPDKGLATISGGGGGIVDLPRTFSSSWSRSRMVEVRRSSDTARLYYTRPDGSIDYSKYWDFGVLRWVEFRQGGKTPVRQEYALPDYEADNIERMEEDVQQDNQNDYDEK